MDDFPESLLSRLPTKSRDKIETLVVERDAAFHGRSHAAEEEREARRDFNDAERALFAAAEGHGRFRYHVEKSTMPDGTPIYTCDNPEFNIAHRAEAPLRRWRAFVRARAVAARMNEAAESVSIVADLKSWLRDQVGPFRHKAVAAPATKDRAQAVASLRESIAELEDRRKKIESAPAPVADLIAATDAEIDRLAERGKPFLWPTTRGKSPITFDRTHTEIGGNGVAVDLLAWACADLMKQRAAELIRQADDGRSMTDAEREAELATIDAESLKLSRIEEAQIVAAADAGHTIPRRREANPLAVLEMEISK